MMFKHYIFTRFNLFLYGDNPYKINDPGRWMLRRLQIFDRYCLPTLINQTCKNFTWVLAFDKDTPPVYVNRYDYLDQVQIIYQQPHEWLRLQKPEKEWLITTRLDNDDFVDYHFVDMLQAAFLEREEVIDVNYQVVDMATGKHYPSGRRRNNSPFLTLVEPWTLNPVTAMGKPHTDMSTFYDNRRLDGVLAYQLIHERNVSNKIPQ